MSSAARIGYVGDAGTLETVESDLGGRLTFVPLDSPGAVDSAGIDCLLCVDPLSKEYEAIPSVVLTDTETIVNDARRSGARVLPKNTLDCPEILLAQIEATVGARRSSIDTDRTSAIMDTVEDVIYAFDEDGFLYWNRRVSEITGLDDDELGSTHPFELFSGEDAERLSSTINDCEPIRLPFTIEMALPASNGGAVPYEFTNSLLVEDETTIGICGIGRDVSEYKDTLRTLERLLEGTRDLMAAEGQIGVAETAVSAANEVLGLSHNGICLANEKRLEPIAYTDTVETSLGTIPTLETDSLAWEVFESGEDRVYERVHEQERIHNPDTHLQSEMIFSLGEYGVLLAGSEEQSAFDDADIYFAKLLAAATESALDRAAKRTELERKNSQLEEFVGVVSHDVRNPLNVAEGSLELAIQTGDDGHLERVKESHRRVNEIIDGLLVLAREGNAVGETRPVVVGTVAEEAWTTVETGDATLVIGENRVVQADRNRLRQLFENAFRNSVEHSSTDSRNSSSSGDMRGSSASACKPESPGDSGDSVEHGSTNTQDSGVTVIVETSENGFSISDDGPGMSADERAARLETEFGTEDGFGLPIIRTITEGHGWDLALRESDSGGLRIEIRTNENGHGAGEQ
ncbi:MAG: PAS domain S-box protein [Euryarchaeota archaeon]|nr:PAS domain S-box protein [Euryarchaeota archaeon]